MGTEQILKKANELGHLLQQHEIVRRYRSLAEKLDGSESAKKLLEDYARCAEELHEKQVMGSAIEVAEKRRIAELEEKVRADAILSEFLATQGYYMQLLAAVNDAIASPTGEPPQESSIIVPGSQGAPRIVIP